MDILESGILLHPMLQNHFIKFVSNNIINPTMWIHIILTHTSIQQNYPQWKSVVASSNFDMSICTYITDQYLFTSTLK